VENPSARFRQPAAGSPCIVVCMDCVGDEKRERLYSEFGSRMPIDRFLVFGHW